MHLLIRDGIVVVLLPGRHHQSASSGTSVPRE